MLGPCPVGGTKSRASRRIRAPRGVRSSGRRVVGRPASDPVRGRESGVLPGWHELSDGETEFRVPGSPQRARRTDGRKESEQEIPFPREMLGEVRVARGGTTELLSVLGRGEPRPLSHPPPAGSPVGAPRLRGPSRRPAHGNHGIPLKSLHAGATPLRTLGFSSSHRRPRVSDDPPPADCPLLHRRLPSPTSRRNASPSRRPLAYEPAPRATPLLATPVPGPARSVTPAGKRVGGDRAFPGRRGKPDENARNQRPDRWVRKTACPAIPVTRTSLHPIDSQSLAPTLKRSVRNLRPLA